MPPHIPTINGYLEEKQGLFGTLHLNESRIVSKERNEEKFGR
jgi:hypothetical protein